SGRPMLIEPYCNDQFFNAGRISALGVGSFVNPWQATSAGLAQVLERLVLTEGTRRRAEELGAQIPGEDGVALASALIEQPLAPERPRQAPTILPRAIDNRHLLNSRRDHVPFFKRSSA